MPQTCGPLGSAHGHGLLPASSILTADSMALEEHGSLEAQLDARDVNGVLRNPQNLWQMFDMLDYMDIRVI